MVFCVDTSAWHHAARPEVARRWLAALSADQIGICDHVRLEILYSANSATDYDALADELDGLARIPVGAETFTRACQVQRELAHVAGLHHRSVKIADLVIAAAAELSGTIVWHYDENYDRGRHHRPTYGVDRAARDPLTADRRHHWMYGDVMRTQVTLGKEELELLDRAAKASGASRSELIRRAIHRAYGTGSKQERLAALDHSRGSWRGRDFTGTEYVDAIRGDLNERLARLGLA